MEPEQLLFAVVFVIGMFAGVLVIFMALRQRALQLEMQHRERMAMIERGRCRSSPCGPARARRATRPACAPSPWALWWSRWGWG